MARVAFSLLVLLIMLIAGIWYLQPSWFLIQAIDVKGALYEDISIIERQFEPLIGQDLLHLKEHQVAEKLSTYLWIDSWRMRKHFPHVLTIFINPKKPIARWHEQWVDERASTFSAGDFDGSWMTLEGRKEDLPLLVKQCNTWQHSLQEAVIKCCAYKEGQWRILLDSGQHVQLGSEFLYERVDKLRFILQATQAWKAWRVLDLRYPHGFAYH